MTESYIQWPSVPSGSGPTAQGSGQLGKGAEGAKNAWVWTGYHKWKRTGKPLILATWNVRTLLDRVGANRPERRTALVTRELKRYNLDIAALSETKFLDKGVLSVTEENWAKFRDEVNSAARETIDVLKKHHQDWFDDNDTEIQGLLAEKYTAHKAWLADKQSDAKRDRFHSLRGKLQKQLRCMKDIWWKRKAEEVQGYADSKNAKLFYSSLKEVYGPSQRSAAPIRNLQGELLTDNEAINKRWSEHFEQLLDRPSSIDPSVIEELPERPLCTDLDDLPTENKVEEAIKELQCGKAAGPDGIPPEVFKSGGQLLVTKRAGRMDVCPKI
ncbi:uncharacterized protein LOC122963391 [Acropora millepora]|uniref:uncharacterized protein LOC122963391 n=1 Tax=Acropora millepora TaxID=45264 RepID=UPI001CF46D40|nr:uncharacterized protein LOC122963391 [Acropora millepora]